MDEQNAALVELMKQNAELQAKADQAEQEAEQARAELAAVDNKTRLVGVKAPVAYESLAGPGPDMLKHPVNVSGRQSTVVYRDLIDLAVKVPGLSPADWIAPTADSDGLIVCMYPS